MQVGPSSTSWKKLKDFFSEINMHNLKKYWSFKPRNFSVRFRKNTIYIISLEKMTTRGRRLNINAQYIGLTGKTSRVTNIRSEPTSRLFETFFGAKVLIKTLSHLTKTPFPHIHIFPIERIDELYEWMNEWISQISITQKISLTFSAMQKQSLLAKCVCVFTYLYVKYKKPPDISHGISLTCSLVLARTLSSTECLSISSLHTHKYFPKYVLALEHEKETRGMEKVNIFTLPFFVFSSY